MRAYGSPHEAELGRALLESREIACRLKDDILVGTALLYEAALGGVKLIVAAEDEARARALLDDHEASLKAERRKVEETHSQRVTRAWRTSLVALIVCPGILNLFSLWLLARSSYGKLDAKARRRYWLALLVDGLVLASIVIVITQWRSPPPPEWPVNEVGGPVLPAR